MSPDAALERLREGNARFVQGRLLEREWSDQIQATSAGQTPFACVLGCIDSRVPAELIFDVGLGDIFVARVAGYVIGSDVLGSMEFACRIGGAKAIVVLGHTSCGAVRGAIDGVALGHLTGVVEKIRPAIEDVLREAPSSHPDFANRVSEAHVRQSVEAIRASSPTLAGMEREGHIALAGAMYDIASGEARFL